MASSAYISASGRILTLLIDADTGTFTQNLSVAIDPATAITLTASGGDVAVYQVGTSGTTAYMNGVIEPDKYPFGDLGNNQAKIRIELDRQIHFGETVTVTVQAAFITDGSTDSIGRIDMSVTNNSLWHDEVGELISDTAKIVYVDPTLGNDTNAAAVNSSDGYYVKTDSEVGASPSAPAGSVVAYATLGAAASVFSTSDTGCILFKRGETFAGATQYMAAGQMIGTKGGSSASTPLVFGTYGTGSDALLVPGSSNGTRAFNWGGTIAHLVFGRGLSFGSGSGSNSIRIGAPNADGDFGHALFVGSLIENIQEVVSTTGNQARLRSDVGFINCQFDNSNSDSGILGSDDFNDFTFREWEFYRTSFSNISSNGQEHPLYLKSHGDTVVQECIFFNCYGSPMKCDNSWGVEFSRCLLASCWALANIESNGDPSAGVPTDRSEDTETNEYPVIANADGAYSKWATFRNNTLTDTEETQVYSAAMIGRYGQAYYSSVHDNIFVTKSDRISLFAVYVESGGSADGGYTRDSYGCKLYNNTGIFAATSSTQQYGVRLRCATTDTFNTTNNDSKGHHDFKVNDNVIWFGSNLSGTVTSLDVVSDAYADALAAGRLDGEVDGNQVYRQGGSQTDFYGDDSTAYSTIAAWEAVVADAANNAFADPEFSSVGYQVSDYASDLAGLTLANFFEAMIDDYRDESLTDGYTIQEVQAAVLAAHQSSTTGKGAYDWATVAPVVVDSGNRSRVRDGLRNR